MDTQLLKPKTKRILEKVIYSLIALVVVAAILFPILWMIPSAWKDRFDLWHVPPNWLPTTITFDNFAKIFEVTRQYNFGKSLLMTTLVASLATVGSLFVNTLAAYAFARIDFPFKKLLWVLYLFPMFVPGITILLTSLKVVNDLKMMDTIFVLFVPSLASAYQAFFFRQFFLSIPTAYEEAAEIDGCNKLSIFFRIFLPMSVTPLIIQGVGVFVGHWNSFLWPTLAVTGNEDLQQVMQVVKLFSSKYPNDYGITIAASLIAMLPPLIIFGVAQKHIVQGVTLSGVK